ncbi:MAG TPA: BTAD domain-containing putative transcriptional regulator, partial [Longimicrobiaceae bacterium]|nr:BTAD domain-containing putative transcriptional regulator [Longimicrobiaceae bacterium]
MPSSLFLHLLDGADLRHPDGASAHSVLAQPKRFALLCYLAVAAPPEIFHRRERLLALLWPEAEPGNARASLRNAVYFLRRSLGAEIVETRGADEVRLAPGRVRCDFAEVRTALDEGRFEDALRGYAGPLLPGFSVDDAPEWNEWLDRERDRLARRAGEAAEALAARSQAAGDLPGAVRWSRRAAELRPDDEAPVRRLMERLVAAGDRG